MKKTSIVAKGLSRKKLGPDVLNSCFKAQHFSFCSPDNIFWAWLLNAPLEHSKAPTVTFSTTVKAPVILALSYLAARQNAPLLYLPFHLLTIHACPNCWPFQVGRSSPGLKKDNMHPTCCLVFSLKRNIVSHLLFHIFGVALFCSVTGSHYAAGLELCIPSWPWAHRNPLAPAFWALGLKSRSPYPAIL